MTRPNFLEDAWRTSSYSMDNGGQCVEIRRLGDNGIAIRDSKDRARGAFTFTARGWSTFVTHLKDGQSARS